MTEIEQVQMMCYQCEQTCKPNGCTKVGVCAKSARTAALQDLLIYGIASKPQMCPMMQIHYIFATLTNTNHDDEVLISALKKIAEQKNSEFIKYFDQFVVKNNPDSSLSPLFYRKKYGDDLNSLCMLGVQGIKGAAAYADNAIRILNAQKANLAEAKSLCQQLLDLLHYFCMEAVMETAFDKLMQVGMLNFKIAELLDKANCEYNGTPELVGISTKLQPGKCILITGHDLVDLRTLLEQCEPLGINVYTHGEMLPAFSYPELKKYKCLKANYGSAWQQQQTEFEHFPGPILFTTNCIMKPKPSYSSRVFTTGIVGYEGARHIVNDDWSELLRCAQQLGGFVDEKHCTQVSEKVKTQPITATSGFNHRVFEKLAPTLLQMITDGKIKGFRFIGGCDGASAKRNVFTELAMNCPKDKIVLTAACGRFKVNHVQMGDIDGIPRLLDLGQCNDIYSAIIILVKLAEALKCTVNELPIELYVSWYEQKATAFFLTLCSLGVKNVHLGPSAPVTVTPNIFKVLQEKFNLSIIE